jgi:hypothetical protein
LDSPRAREFYIIGPQHFKHLSANQPHDQRHLEQPERDRRQDKRLAARRCQKSGTPAAWQLDRIAATK